MIPRGVPARVIASPRGNRRREWADEDGIVKRLVAALAVLAILLTGGWLVLRQVAQTRLQSGIAQFRAGLGPDAEFTYATATTAPWRLGADFTDARVRRQGVVTTASHVALTRAGSRHIGRATLRDVRLDGDGIGASASVIDASDLSTDVGGTAPLQGPFSSSPASSLNVWIGRLRAHDIELHASVKPAESIRIKDAALDQQRDGQDGFIQQAAFDGVGFSSGGAPTVTADHVAEHARWSRGGRALADSDTTGLWFPSVSALGQQLGQFGYQGAHGSAHTSMRYDRQAGTMFIEPLSIRLDGIAVLALSLGLDHLPALEGRTVSAMLLAQASLTGLTLRYDDAGLAGHVLATMAQRSGVTRAQFLAALTANLNSSMPNQNGQEAIRFLNDPRRFVIALRPPVPLSAAGIASLQGRAAQDDIIRALGFSFTAD